MAQTSQRALAGDTTAQTVLPIVGRLVGDIWGPIGGMVGTEIGTGVGNMFATGDAAGAASGTEASSESNLGGLFQGQGLSGFWDNFLRPQLEFGPGAGEGHGSLGSFQAIQEMRGGYGGPSQGIPLNSQTAAQPADNSFMSLFDGKAGGGGSLGGKANG